MSSNEVVCIQWKSINCHLVQLKTILHQTRGKVVYSFTFIWHGGNPMRLLEPSRRQFIWKSLWNLCLFPALIWGLQQIWNVFTHHIWWNISERSLKPPATLDQLSILSPLICHPLLNAHTSANTYVSRIRAGWSPSVPSHLALLLPSWPGDSGRFYCFRTPAFHASARVF